MISSSLPSCCSFLAPSAPFASSSVNISTSTTLKGEQHFHFPKNLSTIHNHFHFFFRSKIQRSRRSPTAQNCLTVLSKVMILMIMTIPTHQGLGRSSDSLLVRSCSIPESIAAKWEMEEYVIIIVIFIGMIMIVAIFIIFHISLKRDQRLVCRRAPESLLPENHRCDYFQVVIVVAR